MDPIALAKEVEARYRRYLRTTFHFRDPILRTSFESALSSGRLAKGPFIEITPVFAKGATPRELLPQLLGAEPDEGFVRALDGDRALYAHQELALRAVGRGRNVIVATGTGSGKTEAFVYPILIHLYREFLQNVIGPGVRALILYPMNALANDQRERLGTIAQRLQTEGSPFAFTFGQYIGETPEDGTDMLRHAQERIRERLPGELVLRSEMRATPPHILLTNYSMLEYLLLRPDDSPLFDNGRAQWWRLLVLDEAHQYRGSRGSEMGMLLRRLKQRLREGGSDGTFRCIATSATLASGEEDYAKVASFAQDLFGEPFAACDLIQGKVERVEERGVRPLAVEEYGLLQRAIILNGEEDRRVVAELARRLGAQPRTDDETGEIVAAILLRDSRVSELRRLLGDGPREAGELASLVFPDIPVEERLTSLGRLVTLLVGMRGSAPGRPLISVRYHLFLRALEGAFVCYLPQKEILLDRAAAGGTRAAFEVALCRECGQHYLVGRMTGDRLGEPNRDPSDESFGVTFYRPVESELPDEDPETQPDASRVVEVCVRCGALGRPDVRCGHGVPLRVVREEPPADPNRADQLAKCSACGYNAAGRDPVRELVHGADGPNAVIATTLYERLPESRKKILAFADGRQEAAFFAWYLQESYADILNRNLILEAVRRLQEYSTVGVSLGELARELRAVFRERRIVSPAAGDLEVQNNAWRAVCREFLTDERRISIEGVALVRWFVRWPEWVSVPVVLLHEPWSLTEEEARDLLAFLFESMRVDRAVELRSPPGVSVSWAELGLQRPQGVCRLGAPERVVRGRSPSVLSWNGSRGRRAAFLAKLLAAGGFRGDCEAEAVHTLEKVWQSLCDAEALRPEGERLLVRVEDGRRVSSDWWRVRSLGADDPLYECGICGRIEPVSIRGVCPRHGCQGRLEVATSVRLADNHYRTLYQTPLPGPLRVEEHTAQLGYEKAREFQREFKAGTIHVLSCSTTFELGVDLGDLETVFLRNVPPESFNYAQRVGRAGRRIAQPGFVITYCARRPHDLYHFSRPLRMLTGKIAAPTLSLRNAKIIIRHMAALALSEFFRSFPARFRDAGDARSRVDRFFGDISAPTALIDFRAFLSARRAQLEQTLRRVVPEDAELLSDLGLADGTWIDRLAGDGSRLALAEDEVASDFRAVKAIEEAASGRGDYRTAQWARSRAETIAQEDVLTFLSRKAVIPKYGFPVDVVELDIQRTHRSWEASDVSLQRDLSIGLAEFAPTSKVIANKRVWTSYGVKRVAGRELERWWYARCVAHNRFERELWSQDTPMPAFAKCCDKVITGQYIDPAFGFVTNRDLPEQPKGRPARVFTTRPYFAGFRGAPGETRALGPITLRAVCPGRLVVLCEGRRGAGFFICNTCGAGFRDRPREHKTPQGQMCQGILARVSLGHEFVTDVLELSFSGAGFDEMEPTWFAYSLAFALLEGAAETLEVPATDLNATVGAGGPHPRLPPVVVYDDVPGGAGLVARLEEGLVLRSALEAARKRVAGDCGCEPVTSCYGCLRGYRNQFAHHHLRRGPVLKYLDFVLSQWIH